MRLNAMKKLQYLIIPGLIIIPAIAAGQDLPELRTLVEECEACHGPGGNSTDSDIPTLAGQPAEDLREEIDQFYFYERHCPSTNYRHGDRPPTELNMCSVASGLNKDEVFALTEYFAAQEVISE